MYCHNHSNNGHSIASMRGIAACVVLLTAMGLFYQQALAQTDDPFSPDKRVTSGQAARGVIANAEFVDAPVTTIFRMVSDMTGWSIVMSPEVSKQPPKINIWIKNLSPEDVLEQVTMMGSLAMERKGTTIRVMTFDEYAKAYGVQLRKIQVKHASARNIAAAIKPFAAKDDQARILADEQSNTLILLVPNPLIDSLVALAEDLDVPYECDKIELVTLKHLQASAIVPELEKFLTGTQSYQSRSGAVQPILSATTTGPAETAAGAGYVLKFMIEPRLNVIVLRGTASDVARAVSLVSKLDVPPDISLATYEFHYVNAKDIFQTIQDIMQEESSGSSVTGRTGAANASRMKLSLSEQTNRIVAEGAPADHAKLAKLVGAVDVPLPPGNSATRVYRLTNATAEEVAKVITGLIEDADNKHVTRVDTDKSANGLGKPDYPPAPSGPSGPATPLTHAVAGGVEGAPGMSVAARVTAVPEINAIVIRASAAEHEEFLGVIKEIDKPRDQVVLEVTVVTVRADTSFQFGMELGGAVLGCPTKSVGFTSLGIGTPDPATGEICIAKPPPLGLNFAVFNSDDFSLVLNALKTVGDVRVTSAPKILVQDNSTAMISQFNQEPYETTSQGQNSTVTSFGGFVDAGTQLTVNPHISQENWLRMDYQVLMSTFGQRTVPQLAANLPPPKRETKAIGTVRVPAEHVVVLGGLVGDRQDSAVNSVPLLGDIPLVGELFKNRSSNSTKETMYIFIRPVILRDPSFGDLIYLSEKDICEAKLHQDDCPTNPLRTFAPTLSDETLAMPDASASKPAAQPPVSENSDAQDVNPGN